MPAVAHVVRSSPWERLANLLPFSLGARKPRHFLDMFVIARRNRGNPGYAWKVLTRGVCDGCAPTLCRFWLFALCSLLLALFTGCATVPTEYHEPAALTAAGRTAHNLAVFDRAWTLVNEKYFDPRFHGVDWAAQRVRYRPEAAAADEEALYRVLNRMNAELKESHLAAQSPRRTHELRTEHQAGVGLRWLVLDGQRVVSEIVPGGPAAVAGVQLGWVMVSRNGLPLQEGDTYISRLGQPVTYGFLDEHDQPRSLTLEPRLLNFSRREARTLPDGFRYLRFDEFNLPSLRWLSAQLKTEPRAPGVIIDLRHNSGGNTLVLKVAVAEFFSQRVDEGRLVRRNGRERVARSFAWLSARYEGPVVLLTSPATASAAEIFSHVLQYNRRATVVGQRTAGAVIVTFPHWLPGGGRLQVPYTDYVGLDGQRLEGRGVTPDQLTPVTLAGLRSGIDSELAAALKVLHPPGPTLTN